MFLYCSDYRKKLQVWMKKHDPSKEEFIYPWVQEEEWTIPEKYALETYYLNEAFICKPHEAYKNFFNKEHKTIKDIKKAGNKVSLDPINCIVRSFFEFKVKKETSKYYGQSMIKAIIEDKNGEQCSCTIFPDRWADVQKRLKELNSKAVFDSGIALSFTGTTNIYEDDIGIILNGLFSVATPPSVPADLKPKKVNLKLAKAKATSTLEDNSIENPTDLSNLLEKIEDALYDEGLIDLEEDVND
jgi:DNA polymerase III alpha subunit